MYIRYNLPAGTSRQTLVEDSLFDRIMNYMVHLRSITDNVCKFIKCGDLNARVSDMKDFVDADNSRHVYALPDDYNADKVLPRSSKDSKLNANGSLLIDFCRQTGLRIANDRVGSDSGVGECTYVGTGGSSLVDYVLVSEDLLQCFNEFTVHDPNPYTDHCVIEFSVNVYKATILTQVNSDNSVKLDSKYQWDKTKCDEFKNNLASADIDSKFNQIFDTLSNDDCTDNIDKCVEILLQ